MARACLGLAWLGLAWLESEHICVYDLVMKRRDLEKRLRALGWRFLRHGGKHDAWTNAQENLTEFIPRHTEINENLAKSILKKAEEMP